jgi:PmbA protein
MSADLQNRAAQAVEMAKAAGAEDAWATASQGRDVEFEFRDGALEKVKDTTSRSLNIEVYADDRYSNHQTTDLSPDRLKGFIAEAVAITRALEPDEHRRITPAELFTGRPADDLDLVDPAVADISREQRLAWCESLDRVATDHERVISATAGVYDGTLNSASASSNGFAGTHHASRRGRETGFGRMVCWRTTCRLAACAVGCCAYRAGSRTREAWRGEGPDDQNGYAC